MQTTSSRVYCPTVEGMIITNSSYRSSLRTTLCDILCTTNTVFPLAELPPPPAKLKPLLATLPFDKPIGGMVGPIKGNTLFQKFKIDDSKIRKILELKRDKELFYSRLYQEKMIKEEKQKKAAIKIQAIFRGYRKRRTPVKYLPKKKMKKILTQFEIQDELCQMAMDLHLKPIDGLNLEWRAKASKRRNRIENAAAFRIQKFFKMIFHRSLARVVLRRKKHEFMNRKACIVTKAIRFMQTKKFVKRVDGMKRHRSAIVIQCQVRKFQAIQRVKQLKKKRFLDWRRKEAAIIIQRNFGLKNRDTLKLARLTLISLRSFRKLSQLVEDRFILQFVEELFADSLQKHIVLLNSKFFPALSVAERNCIASEVENAIEMTVIEYVIEFIKEENERLMMERGLLEEQMSMMSEDTLISGEKSSFEEEKGPVTSAAEVNYEKEALIVHEEMAKELVDAVLSTCFAPREAELEEPKPRPLSASELFVDRTVKEAINSVTRSFLLAIEEEKRRKEEEEAFPNLIAKISVNLSNTAIESALSAVNDAYSINFESSVSKVEPEDSILTSTIEGESSSGVEGEESRELQTKSLTESKFDESFEDSSRVEDSQWFESSVDTKREEGRFEEDLEPSAAASLLESYMEEADALEEERSLHSQLSQISRGSSILSEAKEPTAPDSPGSVSIAPSDANDEESVPSIQTITVVSKSSEEIKHILEFIAQGQYDSALQRIHDNIQLLEASLLRVSANPTLDPLIKKPKLSMVINVLLLLKARSLQGIGLFAEAKKVLDHVSHDRLALLYEKHYLMGEVYFYMAEWYRALSLYNEAEPWYLLADKILLESFKNDYNEDNDLSVDDLGDASHHHHVSFLPTQSQLTLSPGKDSVSPATVASTKPSLYTVYKLYHRNIIAYTEALRASGQYYKSFHLVKRIQHSLLQYKSLGLQSFEVKEEFLSHYLHFLLLQGNYKLAISLQQELLDKRRLHYGDQHYKIASSYYALGKLFLLKGNYEAAIQYIEDSLQLRGKCYPVHYVQRPNSQSSQMQILHPAIAKSILLKSEGFACLGHYELALVDSCKALAIYQALFTTINPKHDSIIHTLEWIYHLIYLIGEPKVSFGGLTNLIQQSAVSINPKAPSGSTASSSFPILNNELHVTTLRANYVIALNYLLCGNIVPGKELLSLVLDKYDLILQQVKGKKESEEANSDAGSRSISKLPSLAEEKKPPKPVSLISPIEFELIKFDFLSTDLHTLKMMELKRYYKRMIRRMNILFQKQPNIHCAKYLLSFAEFSKIRGNYLDAKTLSNLAYDMMMSVHGELHPLTIAILSECSDNLRIPGYYSEAMSVNAYALKLAYVLYPASNESLLQSLSLIPSSGANAQQRQRVRHSVHHEVVKDIEEVLSSVQLNAGVLSNPLTQNALDLTQPLQLRENVYIMQILYHRAALYRDTNQLHRAESLTLYIIHYYMNHLLNNTGIYALALNLLGDIHRLQGRYRLSRGLLMKSIRLIHQYYSNASIYYLEAIMNCAILLMDAHQWNEAFQFWLQEILPLCDTIFGKQHPYYLYCRVNFLLNKFILENESILLSHHHYSQKEEETQYNNNDSPTGGRSFSSQSILRNNAILEDFMKQSEDIQNFHRFWEKNGFSSNHPWLLRVKLQLSDCLYYLDSSFSVTFSQSLTLKTTSLLNSSTILSEEASDLNLSEYADDDRSVGSSFENRSRQKERSESVESSTGTRKGEYRRESSSGELEQKQSLEEKEDGSKQTFQTQEGTVEEKGAEEKEDEEYSQYRKSVLSVINEKEGDVASWVSDSASQSYEIFESANLSLDEGTGSVYESRPSIQGNRYGSEQLSSYSPHRIRAGGESSPSQSYSNTYDDSRSYYSSFPTSVTHSISLHNKLKNTEASSIRSGSYYSRQSNDNRPSLEEGTAERYDDGEENGDTPYEGSRSLVAEDSNTILSADEFNLRQIQSLAEPSEITLDSQNKDPE